MIDVEDLDEDDLVLLEKQYRELAERARSRMEDSEPTSVGDLVPPVDRTLAGLAGGARKPR